MYYQQPPQQPPPPPQTVTTRRGANHVLHLILTVCTCGLWALTGWPIAAMIGRRTRTTATPLYAPPQPVPLPQWQQPPGQLPPAGYQQPGYSTPPPGAGYGPPPQMPQQPPGGWPPAQP